MYIYIYIYIPKPEEPSSLLSILGLLRSSPRSLAQSASVAAAWRSSAIFRALVGEGKRVSDEAQ